jgi:hypothetical protein
MATAQATAHATPLVIGEHSGRGFCPDRLRTRCEVARFRARWGRMIDQALADVAVIVSCASSSLRTAHPVKASIGNGAHHFNVAA